MSVEIDVIVNSDQWQAVPHAEEVVRRAIDAAAMQSASLTAQTELAIMLTDDAEIRTLNRQWRKIDKATNVLSFPATPIPGTPQAALGDIAIAFETLQREADDEGKPFDHHLSHLAVHGFLHLVGYDHETDDDAEKMEGLERGILASLDIPDPYSP